MSKTIQQQLERLRALVDSSRTAWRSLQDREAIQTALAIIDKLEITADGVPIVPGMTVYYGECGQIYPAGPICFDNPEWLRLSECYSTREAVEAAAKGS